jgi:nitrate reductase gamma subunit
MEALIGFGRGALFRLSFALMVLGLVRILWLDAANLAEAYRNSSDRIVPWKEVVRQTIGWLVPVRRLWTQRPVYSSVSFLFHVGLILTPLLLPAHVLLWKQGVGIAWPALPQVVANYLTLLTIAAAVAIFMGRVLSPAARKLSRFQDFIWPPLLAVPFATGYVASNVVISPATYQSMMLVHVYAADLIMVMIPFTKIAHCVLTPLSQLVTQVAWKFVPGAGDRVAETLGYASRPSWVAKARRTESTLVAAQAPAEGPKK